MARCDPPPVLPPLPLAQSAAYAAGVRILGAEVAEVPLDCGRATVLRRRICPGIAVRLVSRGPVWSEAAAVEEKAQALRALARHGPCLVTPECAGDAPALRAGGFGQVLTPAHVADLHLAADPEALRAGLAGSWRHALRRAERTALHVSHQPFKSARDGWLLAAEEAQRRAKGYRALPTALVPAMARQAPRDIRTLTARARPGGAPLAAILVIRHGAAATYHIGWSGPEGRAANAAHLLIWQAMLWAAAKGVQRFDLGTIDAAAAPGLMRFKLGTGATPRALGGTWARFIPPWR